MALEVEETLDALIEASIARAAPYVRESFELPERAFGAARLLELFEQPRTVAFATATGRGHPRVAPVTAFIYEASFVIPTVRSAARCRNIQRNPETSLTGFEYEWAILAHGPSTVVTSPSAEFAAVDQRAQTLGLVSVLTWGDGVYLQLAPRTLLTWAREPTDEAP